MSFTNTFETTVLTWSFTTDSATRPTEWHTALYTVAPDDTGGGTEVSGGGYARQETAFTVSGNTASNTSLKSGPSPRQDMAPLLPSAFSTRHLAAICWPTPT